LLYLVAMTSVTNIPQIVALFSEGIEIFFEVASTPYELTKNSFCIKMVFPVHIAFIENYKRFVCYNMITSNIDKILRYY